MSYECRCLTDCKVECSSNVFVEVVVVVTPKWLNSV